MKAIVKEKPIPGAVLREMDIPRPGPKDVLIRVKAGAICGSDVHIFDWDQWAQKVVPGLPHILGHEFAGEVVEAGKEVHHLKPGDHVAGETHIPCDNCYFCLTGQRHICMAMKVYGVHSQGIFSEYTTVPEPCAVKISGEIPFVAAAMMEPCGVAVHGLSKGVISGKTLAIFGCGPIGLFGVQAAIAYGAAKVYAIDLSENRLKMAKSFGAYQTFAAGKDPVEKAILDETRGIGVDMVLEVSGSQMAYDQGLSILRKAGTFVIIGVAPKPIQLEIPTNIMYKEAKIFGITGREMYETWYQVSGLIQSGKVNLEKVVSHQLPPEKFEEGFKVAKEAQHGKVAFIFG
ncbi:MAG: alcohol dehydrogenase catalytic domain-containing protein [Thermodesulfobacteriota bacterium]|nr:alcohol dehydrogenase catalytic domain-containing protein [Thermodesulfobacteriota bacterium]